MKARYPVILRNIKEGKLVIITETTTTFYHLSSQDKDIDGASDIQACLNSGYHAINQVDNFQVKYNL